MIRTKMKFNDDDQPVLLVRVTGEKDIYRMGITLQQVGIAYDHDVTGFVSTQRFARIGRSVITRLRQHLGRAAYFGVTDWVSNAPRGYPNGRSRWI